MVYLISCTRCSAKYVGETGNTLRTRMNQHRWDIINHIDSPIAHHFNSARHTISNLRITILQSGPFSDNEVLESVYRRNAESVWIGKLHTVKPLGLNIDDTTASILPFVIPYSRQAGIVSRLVRQTYKKSQLEFPKIFTRRFITAYSRNNNLKDMLVSTRLK